MQMSPLDLPVHKKMALRKVFFFCVSAHAHMGKWQGVEWVDQWVVVNTKQQGTQHLHLQNFMKAYIRRNIKKCINAFLALNLWSFQGLWEKLHFCVCTDIEA